MCYFKSVKKIDSINEIQRTIARMILSKNKNFDYQSISNEIKNELKQLGLSENVADSYMVDNMINDTLEQMSEKGNITYFNNLYIPCEKSIKKVIYAFA